MNQPLDVTTLNEPGFNHYIIVSHFSHLENCAVSNPLELADDLNRHSILFTASVPFIEVSTGLPWFSIHLGKWFFVRTI